MMNLNSRALLGRETARLRLKQTTALGAIVFAGMAIASPAHALDECGTAAGGTVTCTPADNPYADGIVYVSPADDLTIILEEGVRVDTSGSLNPGLSVTGDGAFDVNGGTDTIITTDGIGAVGALVTNISDPINVTLDQINTTGASAAGVLASSVSGAVTVNTNAVTTEGSLANGIDVITGSGAIAVDAGSVTTTGDGSIGIVAITNTGDVNVTSDMVMTSGLDAVGIYAASSEAVTVDAGTVSTTGLNASGIVALGGTGTDVTFSSITTTGDNAHGVLAGPLAAGSVTINGGNITTIGEASDGVQAIADTGAVSVDVSGSITTTGDDSRGIFASGAEGVTVANTGTIMTAGTEAHGVQTFSANGPVSVSVNNVATSGDGAVAVQIDALAGNATANINGNLVVSGAGVSAVNVNSGGNAVVNAGSGATFAAADGNFINLASAGTSTLNNAGTIGNNTNGFAVVATGGPVTINNSGNLSSDIVLTAGNDVVNNSGTFTVMANPDFGAGNDVFNNSGTILVGAGATAPVAPVFTGLDSMTNSGTIELRNGVVGDTLTLPGSYVGTNGTLGLDVLFNGTTNPSDQLIIGGAATGTTTVELNRVAGSQPVFNPGTVLVNAGAGTSANAFDLAGGFLEDGFVRYEIQYNGANNDFSLTGAPSDAAYRTLNYAEGIRSIWLKSADAVSAQLRAQRDALWAAGGSDPAGRFWVQLHGSKETREGQRDFNAFGQSRITNTGFDQDFFGGQMGLDIAGGSGDRGGFAAGLTGGYVNSSQTFPGVSDGIRYDVANAGLYASYTSGNVFINALGKYDYYWANARAAGGALQQNFKGGVYGARGEIGMRFGSDSFFIEPAASISWVKNDFDDFTPAATIISFDSDEGLRGRAGARLGTQFDMGGAQAALYAGANYIHEFKGEDNVTFTSGGQSLTFTNDRLRDYGEATIGLSIAQTQNISGFFEGSYIRSFSKTDGNLGIEGLGGRAGIRARF